MGSLGATGNGGIWGTGPFHDNIRRRRNKKRNTSYRESKPSTSVDSSGGGAYRFPLKQAVTAAASSATVWSETNTRSPILTISRSLYRKKSS